MAAAAVVGLRGRRTKSFRGQRDGLQDSASQLPPVAKRKMDLELSTLLNGTWQTRRVVYSTNEIFFLLVNEENVRDYVPMQDIEAVEFMDIEDRMNNFSEGSFGDVQNSWRRQSDEKGLKRTTFSLRNNRFQVRTIPNGFNSGRTYYFKVQTADLCNKIVEDLRKYSEEIKKKLEVKSKFKESQKAVAQVYNSMIFQSISSIVILLNFCICIATAELGLEHIDYTNHTLANDLGSVVRSFEQLDFFFVTIFTLELTINAYAHWFSRFIRNGWSIFDLIVVFLSILGLAPIGIPLSLLLLLRSCRVLRIFGKLKAVSKIFAALAMSILPMGNVFFIIFIIACIYATAGVSFFFSNDPDNFSTFSSAFMAMFNITVGSIDWWFESFPAVNKDGTFNWFPTIFLISYIVLVVWVFFQVSIAVLLDNFLAASNELQVREALEESKKYSKQFRNPLDPLLLRLAKDYCNEADLSHRIQEIFVALDSDNSGDLSSEEFQAAMKKLDFNPCIFVSDSDFVSITHNGALCNEKGCIGPKEFEKVLLEQLRLYSLARLSTTSDLWSASEEEFTIIGSLKQILMEQLSMRKDIAEILARLPPRSTNIFGNSCEDEKTPGKCRGSDDRYIPSTSKNVSDDSGSSEIMMRVEASEICNHVEMKRSSEASVHAYHAEETIRPPRLNNRALLKIDRSPHICFEAVPEAKAEADMQGTLDICGSMNDMSAFVVPIQNQDSMDSFIGAQRDSVSEAYTSISEAYISLGTAQTNLNSPPQENLSFKTINGLHSGEVNTTRKETTREHNVTTSESLLLSQITGVPSLTALEELPSFFRKVCLPRLSYLDANALRDASVTAELCHQPARSAMNVEEPGPRVLLL